MAHTVWAAGQRRTPLHLVRETAPRATRCRRGRGIVAVAGRTVSRRLSEGEAELYRSWITNRRHLEQVVAQMEVESTDVVCEGVTT
jgi:hypothetical protein